MKIAFDNFKMSEENNNILSKYDLYSYNDNTKIKEFEKNFAEYTNSKYCMQIDSGINVLKIALEALKIKKNDEILIQGDMSILDLTYLIKLGYKFKCLDIDSTTLMIDISKLEQNIDKTTKVIIASHLYGNCADMDNIMKIAKKHKIYVIEDVTDAIGSFYKNQKLGSIGDIGCFSFNANNNLKVLGNCGAIITNNEKIFNVVKNIDKKIKNEQSNDYAKYISPNSLDYIQADMLNNNLTILDNQNKIRRHLRKKYIRLLSVSKDIVIPEQKCICDSASNVFIIKVLNKQIRNKLRKYLDHYNISTKIHKNVENLIEQWDTQHIKQEVKLLQIQEILDCVIYLPIFPQLSEEKVIFITQKLCGKNE